MKKLNLLSKAEMRNVVGGSVESEDSPKIKACEGKKVNDSCKWIYKGAEQTGTCQSYMAQAIHCSDLP